MHDFLLAKEIIDELLRIAQAKKLKRIRSAKIDIGNISLAHDGSPEHVEDISLENLEFGLQNIAQNTILAGMKFDISKTKGGSWKITDLGV